MHCRQLTPQQRTHIITHYFKKNIIHSTTSTHLACTTLRECQTSTSCTDPCARWVSLADSSSHSMQSPTPKRRPWAKANSFRSGSGSGSHRHPITSCFLPEHNSVTTGERSKKDTIKYVKHLKGRQVRVLSAPLVIQSPLEHQNSRWRRPRRGEPRPRARTPPDRLVSLEAQGVLCVWNKSHTPRPTHFLLLPSF